LKQAIIRCKNVTLGYENMTVLEDVSFALCEGDYLCVVGENGAGKSTLIKCLAGLKKPMAGEIVFSDEIARRDVGYLPQQTAIQRDFPASVREVVLSGCLNHSRLIPFYTKADRERAARHMEELGITELAEKSYRELSGGQQQRVLLARALCASNKMLILDEPVTGLDPVVTSEIYGIIKKVNKKYNMTIIMVSHDVRTAVRSANRILHLKHTVQFFGATEDYLASSTGREFIGGQRGNA
jgi:ABC-type Mn/Zn transport systems, ATPase component